MARITLITGILLVLLGVPFFLGQFAGDDGKVSWTPFIPAIPGLLLIGAGWLAVARPGLRMHVMHVAVLLGLLVALAGFGMGLPKVLAMLTGGEVERSAAAIEQVIMGLIGAVYVGLGVKSFIDARRARKAEAGE
ncbi:MAG: hypothetical protein ACODAQ_06930 [Phycisphaeraceae bacterium]